MSTSQQLLKAYGHLPDIGLGRLFDSKAREAAGMVDSSVLVGRCCGVPDVGDKEIANAAPGRLSYALGMEHREAEYLVKAHQRLLRRPEEATGRGSIPAGCHLDLYPHPDRHCATYFVKWDTFNANWMRKASESEIRHVANAGVWWSAEEMVDRFLGKPILDVGLVILEETYRRVGIKLIEVDKIAGVANIVLLCRFISGGTIGIGWFNDGSCLDRVESHYDSSWKPDLYQCSLLLNHEVGHNLNLQHQFSGQNRHKGVMSYSWPGNTYGFLTGDEGILPRDPSWSPLTKFFGGEPIPTDDAPPQDPSDRLTLPGELFGEIVDGKAVFRGSVAIEKGFEANRDVRLIVTPIGDGRYVLKEPLGL